MQYINQTLFTQFINQTCWCNILKPFESLLNDEFIFSILHFTPLIYPTYICLCGNGSILEIRLYKYTDEFLVFHLHNFSAYRGCYYCTCGTGTRHEGDMDIAKVLPPHLNIYNYSSSCQTVRKKEKIRMKKIRYLKSKIFLPNWRFFEQLKKYQSMQKVSST